MHSFSVFTWGLNALTTQEFCGPDVQTGIYLSRLSSLLVYRPMFLAHGNQDKAE